jgi:hypothetical protein
MNTISLRYDIWHFLTWMYFSVRFEVIFLGVLIQELVESKSQGGEPQGGMGRFRAAIVIRKSAPSTEVIVQCREYVAVEQIQLQPDDIRSVQINRATLCQRRRLVRCTEQHT